MPLLTHLSNLGERVPYTGKMGRYVTNLPTTSLVPGDTLSNVFDLSQGYNIQTSGQVEISFQGKAHARLSVEGGIGASSDTMGLFSQNNQRYELDVRGLGCESYYCRTCSRTAEVEYLDQATAEAVEMLELATECMAVGMPDEECQGSFDTWFGDFSNDNSPYLDERLESISQCFPAIEGHLMNFGTPENRDCNPYQSSNCDSYICSHPQCSPNVFAFVYPTVDQYMFLCDLVFNIPDEAAGTLIHEDSHYQVVCGTDDYAYGEAQCRALAQSFPDRASRNADNIGYFARNLLPRWDDDEGTNDYFLFDDDDSLVCFDTCETAYNDVCEDGRPGASESSCKLGTDCWDCEWVEELDPTEGLAPFDPPTIDPPPGPSPTPDDDDSGSSGGGLNSSAIVGVVVPVVGILFLVGAFVLFKSMRSKNNQQRETDDIYKQLPDPVYAPPAQTTRAANDF